MQAESHTVHTPWEEYGEGEPPARLTHISLDPVCHFWSPLVVFSILTWLTGSVNASAPSAKQVPRGWGTPSISSPGSVHARAVGHFYKYNPAADTSCPLAITDFPTSWVSHEQIMESWLKQLQKLSWVWWGSSEDISSRILLPFAATLQWCLFCWLQRKALYL